MADSWKQMVRHNDHMSSSRVPTMVLTSKLNILSSYSVRKNIGMASLTRFYLSMFSHLSFWLPFNYFYARSN